MKSNEEAARDFYQKLEREAFYSNVEEDKQSYDEGPDLKQDVYTKKHRNPMSHLKPKKKKRK